MASSTFYIRYLSKRLTWDYVLRGLNQDLYDEVRYFTVGHCSAIVKAMVQGCVGDGWN